MAAPSAAVFLATLIDHAIAEPQDCTVDLERGKLA